MLIINYILGKSELISYSDQSLLSRRNPYRINGLWQRPDRVEREQKDSVRNCADRARKDSVRNWKLPARLRGVRVERFRQELEAAGQTARSELGKIPSGIGSCRPDCA